MTPDLSALLRRRKPDKQRAALRVRARAELIAASDIGGGRPMLVPDTNVYILDAAGRLPDAVASLIDRALLFHCAVCLGELATGVANADPGHPGWKAVRDHYAALFDAVPASRLLTPDAELWAEAGLIAGTLARVQGFQPHQRKACLNDALIYLTAAKAGVAVLTANRDEFDRIQQLAPHGRFVHF